MKKLLSLTLLFLATNGMLAQVIIDGELRPRFEYRHGFGLPFPDDADPAAFVSQRTRINTKYVSDIFTVYISVQDIRVWGDVKQLNTADNNGLGLHQAWAQLKLGENSALKLGRQVISYDDQRILGGVGWAQQARSHDVALYKYNIGNFKMEAGFAFNQGSEAKLNNNLTVGGTYKSLQFLWMNKKWENSSLSLLFLNKGDQNMNGDPTRHNQTLGGHLKFGNAFKINSNLYYQFGKDINNNTLSGLLASIEGVHKFGNGNTLTTGIEYISGNDNGSPNGGKNKAFTPWFGTNHKFNGLMDYFYVGNHMFNSGLIDLYSSHAFLIGEKSKLSIAGHYFWSSADVSGTDKKNLGAEIDLVYSHKISKLVSLQAGYSHLIASDAMDYLKNNFDGNSNNWAWAMITFKPTFLNSSKK